MKFTTDQIVNTLDKLGIEHGQRINHKDWLKCKCGNPTHTDNHMSNCSINLKSLYMSCFVCGYKKHIIDVVRDNLNCEYEEAKDYIVFNTIKMTTQLQVRPVVNQVATKKKVMRPPKKIDELQLTDFDPKAYQYTHIRGFYKEYLKKFNIKLCLSLPYVDHMIIPIIDKEKSISTYEARKIMKLEYYQKFFPSNTSQKFSYADYEKMFDTLRSMEKWKFHNGGIINKNGDIRTDFALPYLMTPKVLYPSNSAVHETLFNIDNLNFNKDVYISEGMGTLPKLSKVTDNFSCIFGVSITESQIDYLKKFNRKIILIYDNDKASLGLLKELQKRDLNVYVPFMKSNDESRSFIRELTTTTHYHINKFLALEPTF